MSTIRNAFYITEWDGETVLRSPCKVDLFTHEIVEIGKRTIICSPYSEEELDDNIEILTDEYIELKDGRKAAVVCADTEFCINDYVDGVPFFKKC